MKKFPKLYKETMTTEEVIEAVSTINSRLSAFKWLKRNKVPAYKIDSRTGVWDRFAVEKVLKK